MFLHIDIDCFFISAHRTVDNSLKNIPACVGGRSNLEIFNKDRTNIKLMSNNSGAFVNPVFYSDRAKTFKDSFVDKINGRDKIRGIVTTSSYEARAFGVKTAMPIAQALQLCPHLVVVPSQYTLYHTLSTNIREYLQLKIPSIEQFSIDEFFCDVSGWIDDEDVLEFAKEIKNDIDRVFDIPVSVGISQAKWISKLATESAKPFGIYEVKDIDEYIKNKDISDFPGIGKKFEERLRALNINTLGEIKQKKELFYSWKKPGIQLYNRVLGIDNEAIAPKSDRKSIGIGRTFDKIDDSNEVKRRIMVMARHITYMTIKLQVNPTTYYLKINYEYALKSKLTKRVDRLFSEKLFKDELLLMYEEIKLPYGAIKISISVSSFTSINRRSLSLIDYEDDVKNENISKSIQSLRDRFGIDILKSGGEL